MKRKYKRMTYADRKMLERMSKEGASVLEIATVLGVHRDTIYKELDRCKMTRKNYSADEAQKTL